MSSVNDSVVSIVTRLAPDRMAPVTADSHLVDDLGYDSPRKMELVATLDHGAEDFADQVYQALEGRYRDLALAG